VRVFKLDDASSKSQKYGGTFLSVSFSGQDLFFLGHRSFLQIFLEFNLKTNQ
jgi:hypothetical protein